MRLKRLLESVIDWTAITIFTLVFGVVLLQIFFRYVLGAPLVWSEELSRYLFVWVSFLGWMLAVRHKTHLRVSVVLDALPVRLRFGVRVFIEVLVLLFAAALVWLGFRMARRSVDVPTITLFFSYALIYAIVPITGGVIFLYGIAEMRELLRGGTRR